MRSTNSNMGNRGLRRARLYGRTVALALTVLFLSACYSPLQIEDSGRVRFQVPSGIGVQNWPGGGGYTFDRAMVIIFPESVFADDWDGDDPSNDAPTVLIGGMPYYETAVGANGIVEVPGVTPGSNYILFVALFEEGFYEEPAMVGYSMDIDAFAIDGEWVLAPFNVIGGKTTSGIKVGVLSFFVPG